MPRKGRRKAEDEANYVVIFAYCSKPFHRLGLVICEVASLSAAIRFFYLGPESQINGARDKLQSLDTESGPSDAERTGCEIQAGLDDGTIRSPERVRVFRMRYTCEIFIFTEQSKQHFRAGDYLGAYTQRQNMEVYQGARRGHRGRTTKKGPQRLSREYFELRGSFPAKRSRIFVSLAPDTTLSHGEECEPVTLPPAATS